MRQLGFWLILALAMFAALELSCSAALFLLEKVRHITYDPISVRSISKRDRSMLEDLLAGRTNYVIYSSSLGWTIKPNGFAPLYRANSKGMRARREYTLAPSKNVLRISTFGDSFTHGDGVGNKDTWQEVMMSTDRSLEVLNFGVGGFGLDQAFLRYQQDGAMYHSQIVLIGFLSENIYRSVNVFRPFYASGTTLPLAKPRFIFEDGRLVLLRNPMRDLSQYRDLLTSPERILPKLGAHDYYFRTRYKEGHFDFLPSVRLLQVSTYHLVEHRTGIEKNGYYDTDSEAFKITAAIFDQFVDTVSRTGAVPIIVVMPSGGDVVRYRKDGTKLYTPLLEYFRVRDYRYVDMLDGFEKYGGSMTVDELVPNHYSPSGNGLVAKFIWQYLAGNRLLDPETLRPRAFVK